MVMWAWVFETYVQGPVAIWESGEPSLHNHYDFSIFWIMVPLAT
jgi:hypothetical protein